MTEHLPSHGDPSPRTLIWTRGQVAHALGMSEPTLLKRLPDMIAAGFPGKIPGINAWSIAAVRDWVAHNGGTYRPYALRPQDDATDIELRRLEQEYGGVDERPAPDRISLVQVA